MHFFYLDETGCTGRDLNNAQQPIFVLGGISVDAQRWRGTIDEFRKTIATFFNNSLSADFELHAAQLVNGESDFKPYSQQDRNKLVHNILDVIAERRHPIHLIGIDKKKLLKALPGNYHSVVHCEIPYLLAFNYMVSYIEKYIKENLGKTTRGMIIIDEKDCYHKEIDKIVSYRRYEVSEKYRLKRLVEFSYPVNSLRHPMIQVCDLIIYIARKFLEMDSTYKNDWPEEAKNFYASCYRKISERLNWKSRIEVSDPKEKSANELLGAACSRPRNDWKKYYFRDV